MRQTDTSVGRRGHIHGHGHVGGHRDRPARRDTSACRPPPTPGTDTHVHSPGRDRQTDTHTPPPQKKTTKKTAQAPFPSKSLFARRSSTRQRAGPLPRHDAGPRAGLGRGGGGATPRTPPPSPGGLLRRHRAGTVAPSSLRHPVPAWHGTPQGAEAELGWRSLPRRRHRLRGSCPRTAGKGGSAARAWCHPEITLLPQSQAVVSGTQITARPALSFEGQGQISTLGADTDGAGPVPVSQGLTEWF